MGRVPAALLVGLFLAPVCAPAVEVGQSAPALTLASVDARQVPITLSDYLGKVVYLDFWSSWCAPCRRMMPELSALRDHLPRDRFEVVAVNVDPVIEDARRFLAQTPVSYPVVVDPTARSAATFGVTTFPAAFLIDREGMVEEVYRGATDVRTICEDVRQLIDGPPPSPTTTIASRHSPCAARGHALPAPRTSLREGNSGS